MVETEVIWQERLDKQNKIIAAYQALYEAQQRAMEKLDPSSLDYCEMRVRQLQLEAEIENKQLFAQRIMQDREQQEKMMAAKLEFATNEGEAVTKALKAKISSPLVKGAEKNHYQGLLKEINNSKGVDYANAIFNTATALGLIK